MSASRRAVAAAISVVLGFVAGWLSSRAGGSLSRAPTALTIYVSIISAAALSTGLLLGLVGDRLASVVAPALAIGCDEAASWLFSPYHSIFGDILVMAGGAVPAAIAAMAAFGMGQRFAARTRVD